MINLKDFRISKGLSQEHMAREIDVTLATYSRVERGKSPASHVFIRKIKNAFPEIRVGEMFF